MTAAATGLRLAIRGTKVVEGERYWVSHWRPARWLHLGDRFTVLRRIECDLMLPERKWECRVTKETPVDLTVVQYRQQSSPGWACVQFTGRGLDKLRLPYRLEDWHAYDE